MSVLPDGLPRPVPSDDGLDRLYWEGTRRHELWVQHCSSCEAWQWGPELLCHACLTTPMAWERVAAEGVIYSWERVWHSVHPATNAALPYVVLLVELPHAGGVRMVGNLVGDPEAEVVIGAPVTAVFEDHDDADVPYTLVQWRVT
ncbi:MAG: OB-fold domain-containing protein [Acidimicrobiales bacterium]|nr:OB-fold domain-containing protein [Acidimicrobiales bacterium]